jgi:hypothetical protein
LDYVHTGRVKLIDIGPGSVGAPEDEIDALITEIIETARAKGSSGRRRGFPRRKNKAADVGGNAGR